MKPANVFQLELASILADRRGLALKLGLVFLFGFPFIFAAMPPGVRVSGFMFLVLFTGFFGAAVSIVRRRTEGHLDHLKLLPRAAWSVMGDFLLAGVLVDLVQAGLVLSFMLVLHAEGAPAAVVMTMILWLLLSILLLNLLGMILGRVMKNNPEVHLVGALCVALIALASGIIPAPDRLGGIIGRLAPWNPLARLADLLKGLIGGGAPPVRAVPPLLPPLFFFFALVLYSWRLINWGEIKAAKRMKKEVRDEPTD